MSAAKQGDLLAECLAAEAQRRARRRRRRLGVGGMTTQPAPVSPSQKVGAQAEEIAWQFLQQQGCRLVARNLKCHTGEIDLIVWHATCLVFVEVRWRRSTRPDYGGALASVTAAKQQRLRRTAQFFLSQHGHRWQQVPPCRFDVLAIEGESMYWVQSAFAMQAYRG